MKSIVAIIQARMNSSRLPQKVLKDLAGKPVISQVFNQLSYSKLLNDTVFATSSDYSDNPLEKWAIENNQKYYRGDLNNVLKRFYDTAVKFNADIIVRITADCPLIDPYIVDEVIEGFLTGDYDYFSNTHPPTFPDGLDTEVFSFSALEKSYINAELQSEKEHVTPYILSHSELFKIGNLVSNKNYEKMRWTLDNKEDYEFLSIIFKKLSKPNSFIGWRNVISFLEKNEELLKINSHIERNEGFLKSFNEDKIIKDQKIMKKSHELYKTAKSLIPGGTQLLSKRPEMFLPDYWPAYYSKSKGCEVWDLHNNHYYDFSYMGIGSCILGYADDDVNKAVKDVVDIGNMNTLNTPEEVELAKLLIKLHPWAEMVRYTRSGGEAMAVAVRIARAYSKKDKVLFCGYHGWHDWYLAANLTDNSSLDGHLLPGLKPAGVPRVLKGTSIPFTYNDTVEFLAQFEKNKDDVGVIVLETIRNEEPKKEFIDIIRKITKENNIPFIVDEITSGWRLNLGGAHLLFNIEPDIAVFAKGISNGYPMATIIGKKTFMQAAQDSFISSTYWSERIGPTAAIATIEKMRENKASDHLIQIGKEIKVIWKNAAKNNNLDIDVSGIDPLAHFSFNYKNHLEIKTLFTQIMLEKGFLANTAFYASFSHKDELVGKYKNAVEQVFNEISEAIKDQKVLKKLNGPVCQDGFKRLN